MGLTIPGVDTGNDLFVTVQPNDLWNAGPIPRWSNADGLSVGFFTDAAHDSYKTVDPVSGMSYLDQLDPEVADFCAAQPAECPGGNIPNQIGQDWGDGPTGGVFSTPPPYGKLVGKIGTTYKELGTNATINVASGETLKLFYWDQGPQCYDDNTGSVEITIAEDSIQCKVDSTPIAAQGDVRGNSPVQVVYEPTLNVDNRSKTANMPVTIVGCDYGFTIQPNGSPIINGNTQVFVANNPVSLTRFHVGNSISRPTCENGQALPDLKLDLNRLSFINAVAPGGKCTNGVNSFKLEIGSDTNGWFGGTSTINLNHCD
jgi:hypothetical protein